MRLASFRLGSSCRRLGLLSTGEKEWNGSSNPSPEESRAESSMSTCCNPELQLETSILCMHTVTGPNLFNIGSRVRRPAVISYQTKEPSHVEGEGGGLKRTWCSLPVISWRHHRLFLSASHFSMGLGGIFRLGGGQSGRLHGKDVGGSEKEHPSM